MFEAIPEEILRCMGKLVEADRQDRSEGKSRMERLRQIPPETGRFLALLAASAPDGDYVEIGTSGGYSALWLSLACRAVGRRLTTFEILEEKAKIARRTFRQAEVEDVVTLVHGDAREYLGKFENIAFCFLDAEKDDYAEFYELVVPRLSTGGLLVADNVISHAETLEAVVTAAESDPRVDSVVVPIGKGELLCRRI
jgi:predicted O-methyltransferase YrrM